MSFNHLLSITPDTSILLVKCVSVRNSVLFRHPITKSWPLLHTSTSYFPHTSHTNPWWRPLRHVEHHSSRWLPVILMSDHRSECVSPRCQIAETLSWPDPEDRMCGADGCRKVGNGNQQFLATFIICLRAGNELNIPHIVLRVSVYAGCARLLVAEIFSKKSNQYHSFTSYPRIS